MELIFLGTGCATPSPTRWHTSIAVRRDGEVILFDCGEGTQIRLQEASISPMKIDKIFITHFHGDHFFGLPGLLFSMGLEKRDRSVVIYGPKGLKELIRQIRKLGVNNLGYELVVKEVDAKKTRVVCEEDDYRVLAVNTSHSIPNLAYCLEEKEKKQIDKKKLAEMNLSSGAYLRPLKDGKAVKVGGRTIKPSQLVVVRPGKKIVYSGDTVYSKKLVNLSRGADVLIHEATYSDELREKARRYTHSTAKVAASAAKAAGVKRLFITHLSKRYENRTEDLLKEARAVFPATELATDLMRVRL